ncbi:H-NS family nucleoid-associated regulatory protein [Candidatus Magnetaquicoccus inordinatus]|uniref:H-NS histone family protein n=1 Tax=Candidatus Magnetaquicoccus inordinatus TaxID=2496818 RepID=UPI00187D3C0A|nr:H-NS histone family protein [Candidatus Magnetaquicoccus inordinatus]
MATKAKSQQPQQDNDVKADAIEASAQSSISVENLDFSLYPYDVLVKLKERIEKEMDRQREKAIADLKKEMTEKAKALGVSIQFVLNVSSSTSPAEGVTPKKKRADAGIKQEPYYVNPQNSGEFAFKRGKKPTWFDQLVKSGVDPETLRIKND